MVCNYFVLGVKAYGATSIVECNYFVWGVKAYGATSIVVCKPTRPTSCGRRRSPSLGQAQECALLEATARSSGNEPDANRGNKPRLDITFSTNYRSAVIVDSERCCFHGSVVQPAAHSAILSCVVRQ